MSFSNQACHSSIFTCMSHKPSGLFSPHGLDYTRWTFIIPVTSGEKFAELTSMTVQAERQSSWIRSVLIIKWISSRFMQAKDKLDES